jgi:hypothetical protein
MVFRLIPSPNNTNGHEWEGVSHKSCSGYRDLVRYVYVLIKIFYVYLKKILLIIFYVYIN